MFRRFFALLWKRSGIRSQRDELLLYGRKLKCKRISAVSCMGVKLVNWVIKYGVCFFGEVTKFYLNFDIHKWASAWDFQQFDILTCVDSDEPLQPPFRLRNLKWHSVSSLTLIGYSSDKQRLWSDCAYALADLRLCWSHIPHCWKSHALAQIISETLLLPRLFFTHKEPTRMGESSKFPKS